MSTHSPALLVPPVRLGRLLAEARNAAGESLEALVRRCGLAYAADDFAAIEAGRMALDEPLVRWLAELYGVGVSGLVPARSELVIDGTEGHVSVGAERMAVEYPDPERLLTTYLALVYALRGLPVGTPIPLRGGDVSVLSDALRLDERHVSAALGRRMVNTDDVREHARGLRHRLVVPVAGILVGLTAAGGLLLVRSDSTGTPSARGNPHEPAVSVSAAAGSTRTGDAVVLERSPGSETAGPQQRRNA